MPFDPLTTNAVDLQHLLDAGKITSVKLVLEYLAQIEHHDHKFRAFISLAPRTLLLDLASKLDNERQLGRARGPLHGIPIVLKDSFITASEHGMETTAGAWALVGAKADTNSAIAQRLLDQGMIILGKTNMTKYEYEAAIAKLKAFNVAVQSAISIGDIEELTVNGAQAIMPIASHTTQDDLLKALDNRDEASYIEKLKTGLRAVGRRILDQAFDDHEVNLIAALADCSLCIHAAAAGYPLATVPLGQLRYNGRPFGLCVVAKANEEEVLLRFMHAWSGVMNCRPVPGL
ncbi:hypothetical protein NEMBOFW57_006640 [Staphylotrichum longicolle]|uniref:Amidase domain-containing protein n=1 Tax=Staphylotrichum longicolle TaxID=669026 RepID=A0AAD4ETY9_9PEZI|nr:hypothetical protein NEMBOFW57_006640 [Staphylotrichum longicolle]